MIQIGKTYLDKWGTIHEIFSYKVLDRGYAGRPDIVDKDIVCSLHGHFYAKTGKNTSGGVGLVDLSPKKELAYWKRRIEEIEAVNPEDKLKLVAHLLDNMRNRIKLLEQ